MEGSDQRLVRRREAYGSVAATLSDLDDDALLALLHGAEGAREGIGGSTVIVRVAGEPVFLKVVPLTDLERRAGNVRSTANLFGLPAHCQYGVWSPGFGAWRELEAHRRTTSWVLDGSASGFPLLYHWRVLPARPSTTTGDAAERAVAAERWAGVAAAGRRMEAIAVASASLVLCLETLPADLEGWLQRRLAGTPDEATAAIEMVDATLLQPIRSMNRQGMLHFDTHLQNLLTDGREVFVTDFGLATAADFALTPEERTFVDAHALHDVAYTVTRFVDHLVTSLAGVVDPSARDAAREAAARNAYIADVAAGMQPSRLPSAAGAVVRRYAPVAEVVNAFYWRLFTESPQVPYPADAIERAASSAGLDV